MNRATVAPLSLRELRLMAEKQVAAQKSWIEPGDEVDNLKLIHELQVQRIELEVQNEMLCETFAQVDALRAKYKDLYDMAPVGYFTLSVSGDIIELNQRAAELLCQEPQSLTHRNLREFFDNVSLRALDNFLTETRNTDNFISVSQETGREVFTESLLLRRKLQMPLYVNLQARMSKDALSGEIFLRVVMMDVSGLKTAKDDVILALNTIHAR